VQREGQGVLHEGENEEEGERGNGIPLRGAKARLGWPNKVGKDLFPDFAKLGPPGCLELALQWIWVKVLFNK